MSGNRPHTRSLKALLLGLLLVCAQALALAHEVVHDPAGEPDLCATCTVGGGLKATSACTGEYTIPSALGYAPLIADPLVRADRIGVCPEARGPPPHS